MFGLLVGIMVSFGLGYLIEQILKFLFTNDAMFKDYESLIDGAETFCSSLMICYISVSFILQTKDDFRFIIPYVEFQRATKGPRPPSFSITSVIIDAAVSPIWPRPACLKST